MTPITTTSHPLPKRGRCLIDGAKDALAKLTTLQGSNDLKVFSVLLLLG